MVQEIEAKELGQLIHLLESSWQEAHILEAFPHKVSDEELENARVELSYRQLGIGEVLLLLICSL
jgi:hypothetical protein